MQGEYWLIRDDATKMYYSTGFSKFVKSYHNAQFFLTRQMARKFAEEKGFTGFSIRMIRKGVNV